MAKDDGFGSLEFTPQFLLSFGDRDFSPAERRQFIRALLLLDQHEQHPSLRVHPLQGAMAGLWSASASMALRMTFRRLEGGRKRLLVCSRHYDR